MKRSTRKLLIAAGAMTGALLLASCGNKAQETTAAATTAAAETTAAAGETTAAAAGETTAAAETTAALTAPENYGTVALGEYKGVEVAVRDVDVNDEDTQQYIDSLVANNPEKIEVDRPAQDGDTVNIDFVGKKDGVAFQGGTAQGYDLVLGSGAFIDGFESGLVGAKKGDKLDLNLTFPEEYGSAELAGKDVVFEVTVNTISEEKAAELTDAWVEKYTGGEQKTVDDFFQATKESILKQKEQNERTEELNNLINDVITNSSFEITPEAIAYEGQRMMQNSEMTLASYGIDLDSYLSMTGMTREDYQKQMEANGENYAKMKLLVDEIAAQENLTELTEADYQKLVEQYGVSKDMMIQMAGQEAVDFEAKYLKVSNFLLDNAKKVDAPEETTAAETTADAAAETTADAAAETTAAESAAEETTAAETKK